MAESGYPQGGQTNEQFYTTNGYAGQEAPANRPRPGGLAKSIRERLLQSSGMAQTQEAPDDLFADLLRTEPSAPPAQYRPDSYAPDRMPAAAEDPFADLSFLIGGDNADDLSFDFEGDYLLTPDYTLQLETALAGGGQYTEMPADPAPAAFAAPESFAAPDPFAAPGAFGVPGADLPPEAPAQPPAVGAAGYAGLQDILIGLSDEFRAYEVKAEQNQNRFQETINQINARYDAAEKQAQETADGEKSASQERQQSWQQRAAGYRSRARDLENNVALHLKTAAKAANNSPAQHYIDSLRTESAGLLAQKKPDDNAPIFELYDSSCVLKERIDAATKRMEALAAEQYRAELQFTESKRARAGSENQAERERAQENAQRALDAGNSQNAKNLADIVQEDLNPDEAKTLYDEVWRSIPDCNTFRPAETFPEGVCFGSLAYDVSEHIREPQELAAVRRYDFALTKEGDRSYLTIPYGIPFSDPSFSTLFEFDKSTRGQAIENIRQMVLNLLMAIPCGKAYFTLIDPIDLGNTFALFSPLGEEDERIIDTRIWSDEARILERLNLIVDHTEDVIQRCLQGRFTDIIEYNRFAGKNAEPLRFLVVMDFPRHFTPASLSKLESIISKGPQNGVFTLIAADKEDMEFSDLDPAQIRNIRENMNIISCANGMFYSQISTQEGPLRFLPTAPAPDEAQQRTIDLLRRGIHESEKITITYDDISRNLLSDRRQWFHSSAENGISVPVGLEGANKPVMLQLGGVNQGGKKRPFHAMVGGTIGSGKSTLLHTIISSILLHYSPEDVQMYLLDFKRGIEFKCYADAQLANFRTVAIDTEPEFGLAVLRDLEREEQRRGALFREENVDRIEAYRDNLKRRGQAHHNMPRIVVIFDEYQEMFPEGDSAITAECAQLLSRVVLQAGSAMGIHIILATQDVSNVKGLDAAIYGQFETRIALKCNAATSKVLLNEDNEAVNQLVTADAGQAVFNEAAGHKDYNHMFRVAMIDPKERIELLWQIHEAQQQMLDLPVTEPRLLLSSVQDNQKIPLNRFALFREVERSRAPACSLFIGESLSMANTFRPRLRASTGQNLLLAGANQAKARRVFAFCAMSLIYETIRQRDALTEPLITLFDFGGSATDYSSGVDPLDELVRALPEVFEPIDKDSVVDGLKILQEALQQEKAAPSGRRHFVMFFGLNRARRLLRSASSYEQPPRDLLAELLHTGPENGMNFLIWANDPSMYLNSYGDTLNSFEHRLVFDMRDDEYQTIVNQNAPAKESDLNAIAFDINDDNQKIRLYRDPTRDWLSRFVANCREFIR